MRKYILADNLPYDTPKNKYIEDMTIMDHKLFKHTINELYHDKLSQSRIEQIFGCYNKVSKYAWQCNMISKDILIESDVQAMGKKQPFFLSYREYDIFTDTYRSYAFDYFDNALQSYANGKLAKNDGYKEIVKFRYLLYQAYFSFIFYTGARKNEARGTLWRDLDLCDPYEIYTVMIDKQYDERYQRVFEEQYTLRKPKYDSARRCVLHEQLIDDLKELKDWLETYDFYDENEFIFCDYFGRNQKPIPTSNIDRCFHYILDLTGIEDNSEVIHGYKRNITLHGMRHSATVNLLEQGMKIEDVALFLGHKSTDMVERVYGQFVNIRDLECEKRIKNLKYFKKRDREYF